MKHYDDHLAAIPLFSKFTRKDLEHVHRVSTEIDFPAGKVLMSEGGQSHDMFVVISGNLEVTRGGHHVANIGDGGIAGELGLLSHRRHNATVTTTVPTKVIHIDGRGFMHVLEEVPQLAVRMLPIVAARASDPHSSAE